MVSEFENGSRVFSFHISAHPSKSETDESSNFEYLYSKKGNIACRTCIINDNINDTFLREPCLVYVWSYKLFVVSISKTCIFATLVAPNRRGCAYNAIASTSRAFLLVIGRQKEETEEPIHSK
jgi:hypothetical protein